jgi:NAD/NADP transhydrogenase beta subunit
MVETAYALYLLISVAITIWVARTLSRNGEVFLVQCFGHNREIAQSTNHLLVVGFYLVNIGFITLTLSLGTEPTTIPDAIRFLSSKVGLAIVVLGMMHFFNMSAIARFGRKVNEWLTDGGDRAAAAA